MNIIHRVIFNTDQHDVFNYFIRMGIKMNYSGIISTFEIGENDRKWDSVLKFINDYPSEQIFDFQYKTQFSEDEINNANFFAIAPNWHFGYPQPENGFGYLKITYNSIMSCNKCGIKPKQIAPFSIKKSPKWGKRNIVQLNWIFDEFFISGNLKLQLERECSKLNFKVVNKFRTKCQLDDIFQLDITQTVDLDMSTVTKFERCKVCNQIKYLPHTRGFFPYPTDDYFNIAHSIQCFGSGHEARHAVLINKNIYDLFNRIGVIGISYIPCETQRVKK
jgi:hypothetical protein